MIVLRIGPSTIMDHLFEVFLCDAFRKRVRRILEFSDPMLDKYMAISSPIFRSSLQTPFPSRRISLREFFVVYKSSTVR